MKIINKKLFFVIIPLLLLTSSCERELSEETKIATYPKTAEVYTDAFGGGINKWEPYGTSKFEVFSIDTQVKYKGSSSIKIVVPELSDPQGTYAGGIFRDNTPRDLSGYDALTFYAKASKSATLNEVGFGEDFILNKYLTTIKNVSLTTDWVKYIIPMPDASKLISEKGMFRFAEGPDNGEGYTIWFDEIKFEKLGNIAPSQNAIMNGNNISQNTFIGVISQVTNIKKTFNLGNGVNQTVFMSPNFVTFTSSNPNVVTVDELGIIKSIGSGVTDITATFNGEPTVGKLTINCSGNFIPAPTPTHSASNVISIFSNHFNNVPVNYYNGYWQPWQTTVSNDFIVNGDNILNYTIFNFVGIEFSSPTINANSKTHFHADLFFPGSIASGRQLRVLLVDFGANGVFGGGDDTRHSTTFLAPTIVSQSWVSIDIPFTAMPNLLSRANLGQIIFEGGDGSIMYADNIYLYNN